MNEAASTPDWIADGLRQTRDELVSFAKTAWGITIRPHSFGRTWARGEGNALNPLAFLATSLAVSGLIQHLIFRWFRLDEAASSLLGEILSNVFPYLWYLIFAVIVHTALVVVGLRPPLRTTLGIVLFSAGGPATLTRLVGIAINARGNWSLDQTIWLTTILSVVFWRSVGRGMSGALDAERRRVGRALGLSGLLVGVLSAVFGILLPHFASQYLRLAMP